MKTKSELKNCPFCGSRAKFATTTGKYWAVECTNCGAWMSAVVLKFDAITAWNQRDLGSQIREEFTKLVDEAMLKN